MYQLLPWTWFSRLCLFLRLHKRFRSSQSWRIIYETSCWLRILMYWYSNVYSVCKWKEASSFSFTVISGVRQGGVLSAKFWAIYMNDLFSLLKSTQKGCHILDLFVACILYADDVCLLAPTRKAMQCLLDTCSEYASFWCIKYTVFESEWWISN